MALGCWRGPGMHLCNDLVIVEPVDGAGRPVGPGVLSEKIYVTAISNPTLPLIRFELTDRVMLLDSACPCGSAHRLIADVEGRLDDAIVYPARALVHPHVFRSVLGREPSIVEYQVRQTPAGAEVLTVGCPVTQPRWRGRWRTTWRGSACRTLRSASGPSRRWSARRRARSGASSPCP